MLVTLLLVRFVNGNLDGMENPLEVTKPLYLAKYVRIKSVHSSSKDKDLIYVQLYPFILAFNIF